MREIKNTISLLLVFVLILSLMPSFIANAFAEGSFYYNSAEHKAILDSIPGEAQSVDRNGTGICPSVALATLLKRRDYVDNGELSDTFTLNTIRNAMGSYLKLKPDGSGPELYITESGYYRRQYTKKTINHDDPDDDTQNWSLTRSNGDIVTYNLKKLKSPSNTEVIKLLADHPEGVVARFSYSYKNKKGVIKTGMHSIVLTEYTGGVLYANDGVDAYSDYIGGATTRPFSKTWSGSVTGANFLNNLEYVLYVSDGNTNYACRHVNRNPDGYCPDCKQDYLDDPEYKLNAQLANGVIHPNGQRIAVNMRPYAASAEINDYHFGSISVTGTVVNHFGHTWYKVNDPKSGSEGYVYCDNTGWRLYGAYYQAGATTEPTTKPTTTSTSILTSADSNEPDISLEPRYMKVNVGKGSTLLFSSYVSTAKKYKIDSIPDGTMVYVYGITTQKYDDRTWAKIYYNGKDGWVNVAWLTETEETKSKILEYSITFNPNGGTGTMPEAEMVCGVPKALPKNTFRKTGDTFAGWSGSRNGPVQYSDQQVVDLSKMGGICLELFAQWEPSIQSHSFDVQAKEFLSGNIMENGEIPIVATESKMIVNVGAGSTLRFCSYVSVDNAYEIGSIPNDTVVYVYGTTTEQYDGRTWAKINYNNTDGWVNVAWLAPYTEQTTTVPVTPTPALTYEKPILSISENNAPAELTVGSNFGLRGIIQTNCGTITNVYAYIYDSNDNLVQSREYTPNESSHNLRYSVNNDFAFGKMRAGTYRYIVEAKAVNGDQSTATRLIDASFRINGASAPDPASQGEPQIQSVGNNMQVAVGTGSTLRFCSYVSLDNAHEIGSIPNDAIVYVYGTTTQQYEDRTWAKINYNGTDGWVNVAWLVPYTSQPVTEPSAPANSIDISEYVGQWTAGMYYDEHDIYDDMLTIEQIGGNDIRIKWELYRIAGFTVVATVDPITGIAQFPINDSWSGNGYITLRNETVTLHIENSSYTYVHAGDEHVYTQKRTVPSQQHEAVVYDPPVLSISGNNVPSDMTVGSNFGIRGIIQTSCGTITRVQAYILDSNYSPVQASEYTPNEVSLDLRYTVNNDLVFGKLPAGSYVYYVEATAVNGDKTTNEALINLSSLRDT